MTEDFIRQLLQNLVVDWNRRIGHLQSLTDASKT